MGKSFRKDVFVGIDDTGKRKYKSVYGKTKAELNRKVAKIITEVDTGVYADDKHMTLAQYGQIWLDNYKTDIEKNTRAGYQNILKNHLKNSGNIRLQQLRKLDLQTDLNAIPGADLKKLFRITVNQILECAIDDGLISKNVCRKLKTVPVQKERKRSLSDLEKKAISLAEFSLKEKAFIYLLLYTGMRRGEVLALTRTDINLSKGIIRVNRSLAYDGETPYVKDPKSYAGFREIDIMEPLKTVLLEYTPTLEGFILFPNTSQHYMTKTAFRRFWGIIYRKMNVAVGGKYHWEGKNYTKLVWEIEPLNGLTPHIFRHNFATILYYAGIGLKDAIYLMGHSDAKTLIELYTHLDKENNNHKTKLEAYLRENII